MRLFTAIELPDEARAAIAATQKIVAAELSDSPRSLRLVRDAQLHLTLVFIGDVSGDDGAAIARAMSFDIPRAPFQMALGGVGVFPPSGPPRVCWLGLQEGAPQVIDLHAHVADRLGQCGVEIDRKPYRPHLTLGRWRDRARDVRARIPRSTEVVARVDVTAVALIESRLSSAGPSYTRLASARLSCP